MRNDNLNPQSPKPKIPRPLLGVLVAALAGSLIGACSGATPPTGALPSPLPPPTSAAPSLFPSPLPTAFSPTPVGSSAPTPTFEPFPCDIGDDEPAKGPADVPLTIIQYGDFQGPYDALLEPALRQVLADHADEVRLVWRANPLIGVNDKAFYAAVAAEAARRQGKFWEMHDALFDHYREWAALTPQEFFSLLDEYADDLQLDLEQLQADLASGEPNRRVFDQYQRARAAGVLGTPVLVFRLIKDGQAACTAYTGPQEHSVLEAAVRLELIKPRQYALYPDLVIDVRRHYSAALHTPKGDITFDLFARQAPLAVNSFVFLAREGWYDGVTFYRVLPGLAAYTGDPSETGLGGPGYGFADELDPGLRFDRPGVVALDNAGPNTNGSRFFITFGAVSRFDGRYTIIGQVTQGLDVLSRLTPRDPEKNADAPPGDVIEKVTIQEQ